MSDVSAAAMHMENAYSASYSVKPYMCNNVLYDHFTVDSAKYFTESFYFYASILKFFINLNLYDWQSKIS